MSVTQIAARAGVSIATVSRVLNNHRRVNSEMVRQVRAAMAELNYIPRKKSIANGRARNGQKQVGAIAVLSVGHPAREWFEMPVLSAVIAEIARAAQEQHVDLLIAEMPDPQKLCPVVRRGEVDGALVFVGQHVPVQPLRLLQSRLPFVRVMGGEMNPNFADHVAPDNVAVGFLAGQYLLEKGCRRLAFLTCSPHWDFTRARLHGFSGALQKEPGALRACRAFAIGNGKISEGGVPLCSRQNLKELIDALVAARCDGLFVSRDEEVVPVYRMLMERGIRPGRDIHVISCDNERVRLSTLFPPPASIELGTVEMARQAVRRLMSRIWHPDEAPVRVLVQPRLVRPEDIFEPQDK